MVYMNANEQTIVQLHNEWMVHICQNVTLHFCTFSVTN